MSGGNRDLHFHHLKLPWVLPVLRFLRRTQATTKYNWTLLSESFMYIRGTTHMNTRDCAPWMNHAHPVNSILWRTYVAAALTQKVVHWLLGARTFICVCEIAWLDTILFSSLTGGHGNDNWFCVTQRVDSWNDVALFFFLTTAESVLLWIDAHADLCRSWLQPLRAYASGLVVTVFAWLANRPQQKKRPFWSSPRTVVFLMPL